MSVHSAESLPQTTTIALKDITGVEGNTIGVASGYVGVSREDAELVARVNELSELAPGWDTEHFSTSEFVEQCLRSDDAAGDYLEAAMERDDVPVRSRVSLWGSRLMLISQAWIGVAVVWFLLGFLRSVFADGSGAVEPLQGWDPFWNAVVVSLVCAAAGGALQLTYWLPGSRRRELVEQYVDVRGAAWPLLKEEVQVLCTDSGPVQELHSELGRLDSMTAGRPPPELDTLWDDYEELATRLQVASGPEDVHTVDQGACALLARVRELA